MSNHKKKVLTTPQKLKTEPIVVVKEYAVPSFSTLWKNHISDSEPVIEFNKLVTLGWCGFKKDSNRGKICGYFLIKAKPPSVGEDDYYSYKSSEYFIFSGKIGGTVSITEMVPGDAIIESNNKSKNYTTLTPKKMASIINNWTDLNSEIGAFLTFRRLSGL
jgi:hypothetical protein